MGKSVRTLSAILDFGIDNIAGVPVSELQDLEIFMAAARCGSFTEAAGEMRLSVATVSRAIARLEQHMDCRLFNRTTRRFNLTAEGLLALEEVAAGMERLRNARNLLHEQRQHVSGTLRVLLPNAFSKHYMMPFLSEFLEMHPALNLDMHIDDFGYDLLAGGFEVVVQHGPVPLNGYISRHLGVMDIVLVASPSYLGRHGVPRTVEELDHHHRLLLRRDKGGAPFIWSLQKLGADKPVVHRPEGQCFVNNQLDAIIHGALCGVGIAPSDVRAVHRYLLSGDLKIILPDYRLIDAGGVYMLYPHRDHVPLKARVFMDFLVNIGRQQMNVPGFDAASFAA